MAELEVRRPPCPAQFIREPRLSAPIKTKIQLAGTTLLLLILNVCFSPSVVFSQEADSGVTNMPITGIETPVAALIAKPRDYLGRAVIVSGRVEVWNSFNYGFSDASSTHYSLEFKELTKDLRRTASLRIYVKRDFGNSLVDKLIKAQHEGGSKLLRLSIMITTRCFEFDEFNYDAELLDWQYLNRATGEWGDWVNRPAPPRRAPVHSLTPGEATNARVQREKKRKELLQQTFNYYSQEAIRGDGFAQLRLGEIYLRGEGIDTTHQ